MWGGSRRLPTGGAAEPARQGPGSELGPCTCACAGCVLAPPPSCPPEALSASGSGSRHQLLIRLTQPTPSTCGSRVTAARGGAEGPRTRHASLSGDEPQSVALGNTIPVILPEDAVVGPVTGPTGAEHPLGRQHPNAAQGTWLTGQVGTPTRRAPQRRPGGRPAPAAAPLLRPGGKGSTPGCGPGLRRTAPGRPASPALGAAWPVQGRAAPKRPGGSSTGLGRAGGRRCCSANLLAVPHVSE